MDKRKLPSKAIETGVAMLAHEDMRGREQEILLDINSITGFKKEKEIWRSDYVGTGRVGAVHYQGMMGGRHVVLKIQGVKPVISEAYMIEQFQKQNRSKLIRPPLIFDYLPWSEEKQYEAFVMELVTGRRVVESGKILTKENIAEFFQIYREYKINCVTKPWLTLPNKEGLIDELLDRLIKMSEEVKPTSRLRDEGDKELVREAGEVLKKVYLNTELEFCHGHFSVEDLMYQGDQVVLFSNLFWKWKYPLYDLVFGYHWEMLTLARVEGITSETVEEQRKKWKDEMLKVAKEIDSENHEKLFTTALLERAVAGLMIDTHAYLDETKPITRYLVEQQRQEVKDLSAVLDRG